MYVNRNTHLVCGEGHLELGCVYYQLVEFNKAQLSCMSVGKLNPHPSHLFLYRRNNNMDCVLKCYEKSLALASSDDQVGAVLSHLYRILGKLVST